MRAKYVIRRCVKCCPEGGAICDRTHDEDGKPVWECRNCNCQMPRRLVKATGKLTPSQRKIIASIEALGWSVEVKEMIGRVAFVSLKHPRSFLLGNMGSGTIGPQGKIDLKLYTIGNDQMIGNQIGVKVYLG